MNMSTEKWRKDNINKLRLYKKRWYESHKKHHNEYNAERRRKIREWLALQKTHCKKCNQSHIATLLFHHLDSTKKEVCVGNVIREGWSIERIKKEIEKCEVLCQNCHHILHWEEKNLNGSED